MNELYCKDENSFIIKLQKIIKMQKVKYSNKIYRNYIIKEQKINQFGSNLQKLLKVIENEL